MTKKPKAFVSIDETSLQVGIVAFLLTILITITSIREPNFLSAFSLRSLVRDIAISSLYALGQAVVIIAGGIDLSVGSLLCFLSVVMCLLLQSDLSLSPLTTIAIVISLSALIGLFHGVLVCLLRLQAFLVTLCSLLIFRGLARVATHDKTISFDAADNEWLRQLGAGLIGGIPTPIFVLLSVLIPLGIFMSLTNAGRYLYAIGSNLEAAKYSGVRIHTLRIVSYIICSVLTSIAAILELGDVGSVTPSSAGVAYEMYGITGAVLGGCALSGGRGSILGVIVGMASLRVIKSIAIFVGISTYWTFALTGFLLLLAVIIDSLVRRGR